jgi:hypothetical protein
LMSLITISEHHFILQLPLANLIQLSGSLIMELRWR